MKEESRNTRQNDRLQEGTSEWATGGLRVHDGQQRSRDSGLPEVMAQSGIRRAASGEANPEIKTRSVSLDFV